MAMTMGYPSPYDSAYSGMPQYPTYNPIYNPNQALAPAFQQQLNGINPDTSGLDAFKQSALRGGPSPWANLATSASKQDEALASDALSRNNASQVATTNANAAMTGGTRSGAKQNIAMAGNKNLMTGQQGIAGQGMQNRSQISINDEQNRIAQLGQLPGMQMQQAGFGLQKANALQAAKTTDLQNQMLGNQSVNQFNMGAYQQAGNIWGAGKQADATAGSGSSSWLCTEAIKETKNKWSKDQRRALLELTRFARDKNPSMAHFYFFHCGKLIDRIKESGFGEKWKALFTEIKSITSQISSGDIEGAYCRYVMLVKNLIDRYWSDCKDNSYTQWKEFSYARSTK